MFQQQIEVHSITWKVLLDNKKQNKQKTKNKHLKDRIKQFFNFSYKNIIHDKLMLSDAALLVQKTSYGRVTLNEVLNNYGLKKTYVAS